MQDLFNFLSQYFKSEIEEELINPQTNSIYYEPVISKSIVIERSSLKTNEAPPLLQSLTLSIKEKMIALVTKFFQSIEKEKPDQSFAHFFAFLGVFQNIDMKQSRDEYQPVYHNSSKKIKSFLSKVSAKKQKLRELKKQKNLWENLYLPLITAKKEHYLVVLFRKNDFFLQFLLKHNVQLSALSKISKFLGKQDGDDVIKKKVTEKMQEIKNIKPDKVSLFSLQQIVEKMSKDFNSIKSDLQIFTDRFVQLEKRIEKIENEKRVGNQQEFFDSQIQEIENPSDFDSDSEQNSDVDKKQKEIEIENENENQNENENENQNEKKQIVDLPVQIKDKKTEEKAKILIVASDDNERRRYDLVKHLVLQGFSPDNIDEIHYLQQDPKKLINYDVFIVYSTKEFEFPKEIGDCLYDLSIQNKPIILMHGCLKKGILQGKITSILPFGRGEWTGDKECLLGEILIKNHPILNGVQSFSGGKWSHHSKITAKSNSRVVCNWSDKRPLIVVSNPSGYEVKHGTIVALNFYPISRDFSSFYWDTTTDGGKIIANTIRFVYEKI
ncbi:hypothetical protein M0811_06061 [Anaeramoeba ignava]|uniref:Uncharacterized protein n=1 Tax=Anaeramoeba ignava TaxID=1746090 RepID=A0A9Q0RDD5_ANAIG|nr:hypothetical protein M0811_06061 [Anaeramoeba ignava]